MTVAEDARFGQGEGVMGEQSRRATGRYSGTAMAQTSNVLRVLANALHSTLLRAPSRARRVLNAVICGAFVVVGGLAATPANAEDTPLQEPTPLVPAEVTTRDQIAPRQITTLTVSGDVGWFDREARTRRPAIGLRARIESPSGAVLGFATTNAQGIYQAQIDPVPQIRVRIETVGDGYTVRAAIPGAQGADEGLGAPYGMVSQIISTADIDVVEVTQNAPSSSRMNDAIAIHQAIARVQPVIDARFGIDFTAGDIVYPGAGPSSYDPAVELLTVSDNDAFDWDVIHHELAHRLGGLLGMEDSPGGSHDLAENLADSLPKSEALRLAWSEGLATFLAVSLQREARLDTLGLEFVGDTTYTDWDPVTPLNFDLEAGPFGRRGAADEAAIIRALWDLYDSNDDEGDTVSLGADIFATLGTAQAIEFFAAWEELSDRPSPSERAGIGCIASVAGAAPAPVLPTGLVGRQVPTITWSPGGLGVASPNSRFTVTVLDATYKPLFGPLDLGALLSWTPSPALWAAMTDAGLVHVEVTGTHLSQPLTAPIAGCPVSILSSAVGLEVDVNGSCLGENGRIDVVIRNTTTVDQSVLLIVGNLTPRARNVGASSTETITVTGRPDGSIPTTLLAGDEILFADAVDIDCDRVNGIPPEVRIEKSCLAGNGRIDVYLTNLQLERSAAYSVFVDSVPPKTRVLNPGETVRVSTTGRPDGSRPVSVRRDGLLVEQDRIAIACDIEPAGREVVLLDGCLLGAGRFDVYLSNPTSASQNYAVEVSGLAPRLVRVDGMDTVRETITGRPDGTYSIRVLRDLVLIFEGEVAITC